MKKRRKREDQNEERRGSGIKEEKKEGCMARGGRAGGEITKETEKKEWGKGSVRI